MRYLICGAGAVGGYVGGVLAGCGQPVVFLARRRTAEAFRARGLTIGSAVGGVRIESPYVVKTPAAALATAPDAILLAVKSQDTAEVVEALHTTGAPVPPVVCLQNGVDNEALLGAAFGPEQVIPATVTTALSSAAPGQIEIERERGIGIAGGNPLAHALAADLRGAGVLVRRYADGPAMKWSKLLTNLLANATGAICDLPPAAVFADRGMSAVEVEALRETLRVMRAMGLPVVNLPGVPAATLAFAVRWLPGFVVRPLLRRSVARGRGGKQPSLYVDLAAGRTRSEVEYLNGAVARHAAKAGLDAPVNRGLSETLLAIAAGRLRWEDFRGHPEVLLATLRTEYAARLS